MINIIYDVYEGILLILLKRVRVIKSGEEELYE